MKRFAISIATGYLLITFNIPIFAADSYGLLTEILDRHVDDRGLVDYENLCQDGSFGPVLASFTATAPKELSNDDARLAFWINAYNVFTLQLICENYPIDSISKLHSGGLALATITKKTAWDKKFFQINGITMSLGEIEHKILREEIGDSRIHFAIVCAAKSCPPLRAEAYEPKKIDAQLNEQGRIFLNRVDLNTFDAEKRIARLSSIFRWFKKDFAPSRDGLLRGLSAYLPAELAADISADPDAWRIRWKKYDWSINHQ